jgi:murein DD-endopeptidase MepM/ murein hydrolase activator NlpD
VAHTPAIAPLKNIRMTSKYGWRKDPFTHFLVPHRGIDFAESRGAKVFATADGVVTLAKTVPTFGRVIIIDHGYGYETVYGHLQSLYVYSGQQVKRGQIIGVVGNSGRSTAPHLHYEVRVDGNQVNPLDYVFDENLSTIP